MKYRPIRLAIRLRVFTRIIRVMTRSIKSKVPRLILLIPSKIKNVQVLWVLFGFIDKSEIRCIHDGEKINMNIEVRNIIFDLKGLGKITGQISKTLSKSGAI